MEKEKIIERLENIILVANIQGKNLPDNLKYSAISGALQGLLLAFIDELKN